MAVDFSSPFVAVSIVTKEGKRFPFWTNAGAVADDSPTMSFSGDFLDPELESMAWVQEVNVELELSHLPILSVTLAPPFREGMQFINSSLIEFGVSTLEVQLGYSSDSSERSLLSPVFSGVMVNPDVSIGSEIAITLQAQGVSGFALSRQSGGRVAKPEESRRDFIQRILRGPNSRRTLVMDDSAVSESVDENAIQLWNGTLDYAQGGKSDWLAVWELANAAKIRPFLEGNKIRFVPISDDLSREPTKIFRLYDFPQGNIGQGVNANGEFGEDSSRGVYPILNFSSPSQPLYLPKSVRGYVLKEVSESDPRATVEPVQVSDASERVPRTSKGGSAPEDSATNPDVEEGTLDGAQTIPGDPDRQEEIASIRAEYWREGNMGIEIEIESVGVPDLTPGDSIVVEGVGDRFGHPRWGVFKVQHSIGVGGFSTTVTAVSNTDRLLRGAVPAAGEANEKKPELSDDLVEVLAGVGEVDLLQDLDSPDL